VKYSEIFQQEGANSTRSYVTLNINPSKEMFLKQKLLLRMVSSEMLRRVALVRTDVSEEPSSSFIRATRIGHEV
jgi:hypothetical protein